MNILKSILPVLLVGFLSCKAQKKYELTLAIQGNAPGNEQLDSTISILKKRLQSFDKGNTIITVAPNQQSITLQTACSNQDFIHNSLIRKGKLAFFECLAFDNPEVVAALTNTNKAMTDAIKQGLPIINGISNDLFQKDNPLLHLIAPAQSFTTSSVPAYIGTVKDNNIPLVEKCLPLLYQQLPNCKAYFTPIDNTKAKASEMYLVKNDASVFDASQHIASAKADISESKFPVITMAFDKVGTHLWAKITRKNIGKYIAIVIDDKLVSAPYVLSAITGGATEISGNFTVEEVQDIAVALSHGYLPLTLQIASIKLAKSQ